MGGCVFNLAGFSARAWEMPSSGKGCDKYTIRTNYLRVELCGEFVSPMNEGNVTCKLELACQTILSPIATQYQYQCIYNWDLS